MRKVICLILILSSSLSYSQNNWILPLSHDERHNSITAEADFFYNSTVITNEFVRGFYTGKYLDNDIKSRVSDNLVAHNRFGAEFHYGIKYTLLPDSLWGSDKWEVSFGFSNHAFVNMEFTEDLFNLVFYGNGMFEDDTAHVGNLSFNNLNYQKITAELVDGTNGSTVSLSVINGQRMNIIDISKGGLYTAPLGEWIDFDVNAEVQRSDTSTSSIGSMNGWGLGTDLKWNFQLGGAARDWGWYSLAISDLGFIAWNKNAQQYINDTLYNYQGFEIDLDNPSIHVGSVEDTLGIRYTSGSLLTVLPVKVTMEKIARYVEGEPFQTIFGVDHRLGVNYRPRVFVGAAFVPSENLNIQAALAFGGYGGAQFQLCAGGIFNNLIIWKLGSRNALDSALPAGRGTSLFTSIGLMF